MSNKTYFWLKLKDDFFDEIEIKRLRRMAGGDTYTIIYLKMLLLSLKEDGNLYFNGIGDDFIDELSLDIDEDLDNVKMTIAYLQSKGLLEIKSDKEYHLNALPEMVGSETDSARRMRKKRHRDNQKQLKTSHSDKLVTESDTEIEIELEKELEKEKPSFHKEREIFDYYISKDIINHNKMTTEMRSKITTALKTYDVKELKKVIDNYNEVYRGSKYYFKQKYGLIQLMRAKDLRQFSDEYDPLYNFLTHKSGMPKNNKNIQAKQFNASELLKGAIENEKRRNDGVVE